MSSGVFSVGAGGVLKEFSRALNEPAGAPAEGPSAAEPLMERALDAGLSIQAVEDKMCAAALVRSAGNVAQAARLLGWTRAQLDYHRTKSKRS